ncbi:MAG: hypothetical protein ACOCVF_00125 [bacterium]
MNLNIQEIIKEEIGNYYQDLPIRLFSNLDFQKQFINDSIYNRKIKVKITDQHIGTQWEDRESGTFPLDVVFNVEYQYVPDKKVFFSLAFYSDGVTFSVDTLPDKGDQYTPSQPTSYFSHLEYLDINVSIITSDGTDIDFTAFEEADPNTKESFIKSYVKGFIEDKTNIPIKD